MNGLTLASIVIPFGLALVSPAAQAAAPFTLTSPDFTDNAILSKTTGGNDKGNPNCRGDNISPAFAWSNAPAATKSFAFLEYDPEGRNGMGVSHLVTYGIPAAATGFKEGALAGPDGFVGGKSTPGKSSYYGGCPAPNSGLHHYMFGIIATDLPPDALEPGLTREEFFAKLQGHALGTAYIIGRLGYE
jgi:Raf kinase inhibitor-like YbhB/YbcL family protein